MRTAVHTDSVLNEPLRSFEGPLTHPLAKDEGFKVPDVDGFLELLKSDERVAWDRCIAGPGKAAWQSIRHKTACIESSRAWCKIGFGIGFAGALVLLASTLPETLPVQQQLKNGGAVITASGVGLMVAMRARAAVAQTRITGSAAELCHQTVVLLRGHE